MNEIMKEMIPLCVEGAKVLELCIKGDELIEAATAKVNNKAVKGVKVPKGSLDHLISARSTSNDVHRSGIPNMCVSQQCSRIFLAARVRILSYPSIHISSHPSFLSYSSDPLSSQVLAKNDVVKLHMGAHIDGFAAISAETLVVGATAQNPATGRAADVIQAAWTAAQVAMRLVKVGNKNWAVTDAVGKVAAAWDCKPVEGKPDVLYQSPLDLGLNHGVI